MHALKGTAAVIASLAATFALSTPAYANSFTVTPDGKDQVTWNYVTNKLEVCDNSHGNGTTTAWLTLDGRTWQKSDGDGAAGGCAYLGPLSGIEGTTGKLKACTSATSSSCTTKDVHG